MRESVQEGFPEDVLGLRAIILSLNLHDVQTGFYNAITVLFEISAAGFIEGSKIEILPFVIPGE